MRSSVGEYSAEELPNGSRYRENPAMHAISAVGGPPVTKINTDRTKAAARIRDIVAVKYPMSRAKFDVLDHDVLMKRLQDQVARGQDSGCGLQPAWSDAQRIRRIPGIWMRSMTG